MSKRKIEFATGEIYHVFNRGVDKREIFTDQYDVDRFLKSIEVFNTVEPVGSIYERRFKKEDVKNHLVQFVAYNLLDNHFHFIIEQVAENGVREFMRRLSGGYTYYFNNKYGRSGFLFQGKFKANHIDSNEYLLYASAYVNLNHRQLGGQTSKLRLSNSLGEYLKNDTGFCNKKSLVLEQYTSESHYGKYAQSVLEEVNANKIRYALAEA